MFILTFPPASLENNTVDLEMIHWQERGNNLKTIDGRRIVKLGNPVTHMIFFTKTCGIDIEVQYARAHCCCCCFLKKDDLSSSLPSYENTGRLYVTSVVRASIRHIIVGLYNLSRF